MPKNTDTTSDESDGEENDEKELTTRAKLAVIALWAWLKPRAKSAADRARSELAQAADEIAPQLRGALDDVSVPSGAWKPLGVAGLLLVSALLLGPAAPFASDTGPVDNGTEPVTGVTYEPVDEGEYRQVVTTRIGSLTSDSPPAPNEVRASAGSQTMSVETAMRDGEPAIVLEDARTHEGRWVAMETSWFEEHVGEIPDAAYIEHEENGSYAAPIETRGGEAAFYVREFSTNTVTFEGEVAIDAAPAEDGAQFEYEVGDANVSDASLSLTGETSSEWGNVSASASDGDSVALDVAGTSPPTGPSSNDEPVVEITGATQTAKYAYMKGDSSGGYLHLYDPETESVTNTSQEIGDFKVGQGADFDGDGDEGVPLGPENGYITIYEPATDQTTQTSVTFPDGIGGVVDADGDGNPAIIYVKSSTLRYVEPASGSTTDTGVSLHRTDPGDGGDVDGDGSPEITFVQDGTLHYWDIDEQTAVDTSVQAESGGAVDDFDQDGSDEVAFVQDGTIHIYDQGDVSATSVDYVDEVGGSGDHDNDGYPSISYSDGGEIGVFEPHDGEVFSGGSGLYSVGGGVSETSTSTTDIDINEDGSAEASVSGIGYGETATRELSSLSVDDDTATISGDGVDLTFRFRERVQTKDPSIELNSDAGTQTVSHTGTLTDGEAVDLSDEIDESLIGGNTTVGVSVSEGVDGPVGQVGLDYSHSASEKRSVSYEGEAFSERYGVSQTWTDDRDNATLTIPWASDRVISVRSLEAEHYDANGNLVSTTTPEYAAGDGELVVELGDVESGWTTNVTATGSKIRVEDGNVTVTRPSNTSESLDSRVRVDDAGNDFEIAVGGTELGERYTYANNSTWGATDSEASFDASGTQRVTIPNATAGGETTLRTWPIGVNVAQNNARIVDRAGDRSEPGLVVRGDGNSGVAYTFVDAEDATPYVLFSETNEIVRDEGLASSPLTLNDDNSDETLVFEVDDGSATSSDDGGALSDVVGPSPMPTQSGGFSWLRGDITPAITILAGLAGLVGTVWVSRRLDLVEASEGDGLAGTARSSVETLVENEIVVGAAVLGGGYYVLTSGILPEQTTIILALSSVPVGMFLVLQQFGGFDIRIWGGTTLLVAVFGTQQLAPELFTSIADQAGIIIVVGAILLGWRALSAWRAEASTPDEVTNVDFNAEESDDGS